MQGTTVNGYKFVSLIGRGGMAEVWKAENGLGVCFAIKVLNANLSQEPAIVERFKGEAKIMVALNHPNIRKVIDLVNLPDGRPCIIMEYLEGADLASRMKRGEKFTEAQLRKWWNQMVDVLNYTHSRGVIHRDIKPSNIFINETGDVKLLDFGIARTGDGLGTRTGSNMGTLMYMSPEQVTDVSRVSKMSDVYSLAVTFVHFASGKPPYDSALTEYTIMDSIVKTPLDTSTLPEPWNGWLKQYLVKEPASRAQLMRITEGASLPEKAPVSPQPIRTQPIDSSDGKTIIEKSLELKIAKGPTDFSEKGGQTTIDVVTNGDEPTVSLPCDWIVAQEHFKNGRYQYSLKIYENFWKESRTAQVKIGINRNGANKEESFIITQKGKKTKKWILPLAIGLLAVIGCFCFWYFGSTLELTSAGYTLPFKSSSEKMYVEVHSNRTVDVRCSDNWISAKLLDDGSIEIKCEKNTGKERIGYVYVETTFGAKKDSVEIRQQGFTPTLNASEDKLNFGAESSEKTVSVESNTSWEITTCSNDFITAVRIFNSIKISCSENISSEQRTGYVVVSTANETNNISIRIQITQEGKNATTGYLNGHEWVDLGLPSGTKWATCNVGAKYPWEYGNYFAWGETTSKTNYDWDTYRYCNGNGQHHLTKYCSNSFCGSNGFTDNLTSLQSSDDAATANWGKGWRMPTRTEIQELLNSCIRNWTTRNGVKGYLFTGPNGNSIFLPAAGGYLGNKLYYAGSFGYYHSCSLFTSTSYNSWLIFFTSGECHSDRLERIGGDSVRPVCK